MFAHAHVETVFAAVLHEVFVRANASRLQGLQLDAVREEKLGWSDEDRNVISWGRDLIVAREVSKNSSERCSCLSSKAI